MNCVLKELYHKIGMKISDFLVFISVFLTLDDCAEICDISKHNTLKTCSEFLTNKQISD